MKLKRIGMLFSAVCLGFALTACGSSVANTEGNAVDESAKTTLSIAYQYGTAYSPLAIAMEKGLIENAYKEATGNELSINWIQMTKGADINTGIASGDIDAGFMGTAPAITGCLKGAGYKIFTNLSGQEQALHTNNENIHSLADIIGSSEQIALVNNGSIQHIALAMALADNGYDSHALDSNIVVMSHPDGQTALESGSIACHLTSSPYIYEERNNDTLYELSEVSNSWSVDNSFIVGVASENLHSNHSEIYNALCRGISDAIDFINEHPTEAADITYLFNGTSQADEFFYIGAGSFSSETHNLVKIAQFMADNGFIDETEITKEALTFDNVLGD